jgi:alpha-glucosidase (family GH31 glycosyl hydrolase)
MPLYVRAGTVLPLGPVKQYSDELVDGPLTLVVYPGTNGTSMVYEDDGKTFNYRRGEFMKLQMNWTDANRRLRLQLAPRSRMVPPNHRSLDVRLAGQAKVQPRVFDGRSIEISL